MRQRVGAADHGAGPGQVDPPAVGGRRRRPVRRGPGRRATAPGDRSGGHPGHRFRGRRNPAAAFCPGARQQCAGHRQRALVHWPRDVAGQSTFSVAGRHAFLPDAPDHSRQAGRHGRGAARPADDQHRFQPAPGLDPHRRQLETFHPVPPATRPEGPDPLSARRQVCADESADGRGGHQATRRPGADDFPSGLWLAVRPDRAMARSAGLG
ncbi:hypothetical protein D9M68_771000 [compost metagenome]